MNEKMKELLELIKLKKTAAERFMEKGDHVKAQSLLLELEGLQEEYRLEKDLNERKSNMNKNLKEVYQSIKSLESTSNAKQMEQLEEQILKGLDEDMFANYVKSIFYNQKNEEMQTINDYIRTKFIQDGLLLVPQDLQRDIRTLRSGGASLETLVNVEPVTSTEGSRLFDITPDITPLDTVIDGEDIPEVDPENTVEVKYQLVNKSCIVNTTPPVVDEANKVLINWIKRWTSQKSKITRNKMIIDKLNEITAENEITATSIDELRIAILTDLDDSYKENSSALMNYASYDYLDNLYDLTTGEKVEVIKNGKLFDLYPVKVLPSYLISNSETEMTIFIGSLAEAITLFCEDNMVFNMVKRMKNNKYYLSMLMMDRVDVREVDTSAVIKVLLSIPE